MDQQIEMDEEKLILLVEVYPEIYDLQNENYMNSQRKSNIWREISSQMGVQDVILKEKWKNLRDGYHRSLKRRRNKSGDCASNPKKWRFEKQMHFLTPYLQERTTKNSFERPEPLMADENCPPSKTSTSALFESITSRKKNIQQQKSSVSQVLEKYLDSRPASSPSTIECNENPIDTFFKAMAGCTKALPIDLQLRVKNKVYGVVSDAEFEHLTRASEANACYAPSEDIEEELEILLSDLENEVPAASD